MKSSWSQTFTAHRKPEGLVIDGRAYFDRFVMATLAVGEVCVLTLSEFVEKRTSAQNRLMWGATYDQIVEVILAQEGYRRDQWAEMKPLMHEGLCAKYQGYVMCPVTKQQVRKFRSSEANKAEFSAYIEWLAQFVAEEYGVAIALPGEAA